MSGHASASSASLPEVRHVGLVELLALADGRASLLHRLTAEKVVAPSEEGWQLRFSETGYAFIVVEPEGISKWAHTLFKKSLHQDLDGHLWVVDHSQGGARMALDPSTLQVSARYPVLAIGIGAGRSKLRLRSWVLQWRTAGCQVWWEVRQLMLPLAEGSSFMCSHKYIANTWASWLELCEAYFPGEALLLKARDRTRKDKHWERCLPEAAFCTCACLVCLAWLAEHGRPISRRELAAATLRSMCELLLPSTDVDLAFASRIDAEAEALMLGGLPARPVAVAMDNQMVWLQPLLALCDESEAASLCIGVRNVATDSEQLPDVLPVWSLLQAVVSGGPTWLAQQLFSQVALVMEAVYLESQFTANPLDVSCDFEHLLAGRRHDDGIMDRLAEGLGSSHVEAEAAQNPAAHMNSYRMLHPKGKSLRKVTLAQRQAWILLRYWYVGTYFMMHCKHFSLSTDGTRLGCKDILKGVLQSIDSSGSERCMWCPPQAIAQTQGIAKPVGSQLAFPKSISAQFCIFCVGNAKNTKR